ncbi:MAG: hypothetical protein AB7F64_06400 [Gammaproteobacteria bacterium]
MNIHQQVKMIGANGQVSLGKEFAGKMIIIDQINSNTWIIKSGEFIPDNEQWLYQKKHLEKLDKALEWSDKNKPNDNFDALIKAIKNG